jgi:phenylacetic acid degradation protein
MDEAEIGEQAIVAASAFVRAGMKVPPRTLVAGVPGKVLRELTEQEVAWKRDATLVYQDLARRCRATLHEVAPLAHDNPRRRRLTPQDIGAAVQPLVTTKQSLDGA